MITTFCPRCGSENPFENQFCGKCGIPLLQPKPAEPVAVSQSHNSAPRPLSSLPPEDGNGDGTISGPSFLGLSDEPELGSSYLLDDEHPSSHWGVYLFLLILAAGGFFAWRQARNGRLNGTHLAALVQNVRAKVSQEKQEAAAVAPNANPGAAENSASNSPAPASSTAGNTSSTNQSSAAGAAAPPPPSAAEIQTAAQKQQTSSAPAALTETAAAAKPPALAAKPRTRPSAPADTTAPGDAQSAALLNNAEKYLYGQGVPQSCDRALSYLRQAVDAGSGKAQSTLGGLYATGHCVPLDRAVAYRWFALALRQEPNNSYLSHDLEMLWNNMTPAQKQLAIRISH